MPRSIIYWQWEEAFDKFGFGDGDGLNFTDEVAAEIMSLGYECECETWGIHNYMIQNVTMEGKTVYIGDNPNIGYGDPRSYLPADIVAHLDVIFSDAPQKEETPAVEVPVIMERRKLCKVRRLVV